MRIGVIMNSGHSALRPAHQDQIKVSISCQQMAMLTIRITIYIYVLQLTFVNKIPGVFEFVPFSVFCPIFWLAFISIKLDL
jgi:hypothetical protein